MDDEAEAEEDEAAEEGQEDEGEDDEEPPARTSRRTRAASTRPMPDQAAIAEALRPAPSDGSRTRSGARTSSTRTASKRDRAGADDPPFASARTGPRVEALILSLGRGSCQEIQSRREET